MITYDVVINTMYHIFIHYTLLAKKMQLFFTV